MKTHSGTHQPVCDGQQHVESLDPWLDVLPLRRENNHRLNISPWEVVVVATWNICTHTHIYTGSKNRDSAVKTIKSQFLNHNLHEINLRYKNTHF